MTFTMKRLWSSLILFFLILNACSAPKADSKKSPTEHLLIGLITEPVPTATATAHNSLKIGDGGFLSDEPCGPPCFFGIYIGRTIISETMEVLGKTGMAETCKEVNYREIASQGGFRGLDCESFIVIFEDNSDRVNGIGFKPSITIRISDVVEKYGSPSFVSVFPEGWPEYPPRVSMVIYYEEDEFCGDLSLPVQDGLTYKVDDSIVITNIGYSLKQECDHLYSRRSQMWNGYGDYYAGPP